MPETAKARMPLQAHCKDCSLIGLCLPLSLDHSDIDLLDQIVKRSRPMKRGEFLFNQGDKFTYAYYEQRNTRRSANDVTFIQKDS